MDFTDQDIPEGFTKILFRFHSEIFDQDMVETLWAEIINPETGQYRIDSVPFYIPFIATDDIVIAEYDTDLESLVYVEKIVSSGNSIVWVVLISNVIKVDMIQEIMEELGCDSEALDDRFFSLEVQADVNYLKVRDKLLELSQEQLINFEEAFISEVHRG